MRVLVASSNLGAGRLYCGGLEVLDAGGDEEERLDCARAEAADFIATDVETAGQLPARVQLLSNSLPYLEGGGSSCETRAELVEALKSRLASLRPGWRIEGRGREQGIFSVCLEDKTREECERFAEHKG
jgi:hypothetical protein